MADFGSSLNSLMPGPPAQYGPDMNAIAAAQRNALAMQQAQQTVQAQNALRAIYANPSNLDPNGQPTPQAINQLAQVSPAMAQDVQHNILANQDLRARLQFTNGQVAKQYQGEASEIATKSLAAYNDALQKGMPPDQATRVAQQTYTELVDPWKANLPPEFASRVSPTFDAQRARATTMTTQRQDEIDKGWEPRTDYGRVDSQNRPTEYQYNKVTGQTMSVDRSTPYHPTGAGKPEAGADELYTVTSNGKQVTAVKDPNGNGFLDFQSRQLIPDAVVVGKVGAAPPGGGAGGSPPGDTSLRGDDYIKSLPSAMQMQVKALADGRMQFPSGFALKSDYWQKMLQAVSQYDPDFDAVNFNARAQTRKDFTSGKSAQNITSFNTAIGHLGTLEKAANDLGNRWNPTYNTVANWAESAKGDPRIVNFNTARQAVADELTRAFRGSGGNVADIKGWEESINSSNSPEQLHAAIEQAVNLLGSRIDSVGEQYRRGMGTTADITELLSPAAKKTLEALPNGKEILDEAGMRPQGPRGEPAPGQAGQPPAQNAAPAPAAGAAPPIELFKSGVTSITNPADGKTYILKDGKVVPQ